MKSYGRESPRETPGYSSGAPRTWRRRLARLLKIVLVTWMDATRTDDTLSARFAVSLRRETVGWLLRRDDDGVVLAFDRSENDFERGFGIPAAYIRSVKTLAVL